MTSNWRNHFKSNVARKIGIYACLLMFATSCDPFDAYMHTECDQQSGECPPYPSHLIKRLSLKVGDSIHFKNDFGIEIGFGVTEYNLHNPRELYCRITGSDYCTCDGCTPFHQFKAITEYSKWSLKEITFYNAAIFDIRNGEPSTRTNIRIQVFDAQIERGHYSWSFPLTNEDDFHESFELGGINYSDVYILKDTSSAAVSKVYLTMDRGIIGFDETETPSTFYLTEW